MLTNEEAVPTLYEKNVAIEYKEIKEDKGYITINARVPQIKGMKDSKFEKELNEKIMKDAMNYISEADKESKEFAEDCKKNGWEQRANEVNVRYYFKQNDIPNTVCLEVLKAFNNGGTCSPVIDCYNFTDQEQAKFIGLKDLFGDNYKEIVDNEIKLQIEQNREYYFEGEQGFKGITENQKFYIEGTNIVIPFDKYEIAPGSSGTPEFEIPLVTICKIMPSDIIINGEKIEGIPYKKEDGTLMIPLRVVAEKLGYEVKWNGMEKPIELKRGAQYINVTISKDEYFFAKTAPVSLGVAPEIKNSTTYVPYKFVSENLRTNIEIGDTITINTKMAK